MDGVADHAAGEVGVVAEDFGEAVDEVGVGGHWSSVGVEYGDVKVEGGLIKDGEWHHCALNSRRKLGWFQDGVVNDLHGVLGID